MKNLIKALIECQKQIENASKDATNPHFKNKYATLESVLDAVKQIANSNGVLIVQSQGKDQEGHFVETKLLHESGEVLDSKIYLVLEKSNMQGLGSAITYARRYSLASLFAIGQEDDDANAASFQNFKQTTTKDTQAESGGEHTIMIGKRFNGKKIKDCDLAELESYASYLRSQAGSAPLARSVQHFLANLEQYEKEKENEDVPF